MMLRAGSKMRGQAPLARMHARETATLTLIAMATSSASKGGVKSLSQVAARKGAEVRTPS